METNIKFERLNKVLLWSQYFLFLENYPNDDLVTIILIVLYYENNLLKYNIQ